MKPLYIRQQQTVADPLQSERLLKRHDHSGTPGEQ